jgi:hypothetical protein
VTVPPGVIAVPVLVSLTVAVHMVAAFTATEDGEQLAVVEDVRLVTVMLRGVLLPGIWPFEALPSPE